MTTLEDLREAVISGDQAGVEKLARQALDEDSSAEDILQEALIPATVAVGDLFEQQEFYVPEMLVAARAMQAGMALLKPLLEESGVEPTGRICFWQSKMRPPCVIGSRCGN
jgi:5-methyltetrahydrofolate--homocysteine methyltransferase